MIIGRDIIEESVPCSAHASFISSFSKQWKKYVILIGYTKSRKLRIIKVMKIKDAKYVPEISIKHNETISKAISNKYHLFLCFFTDIIEERRAKMGTVK
jgi:hypothetical protein